MMRTPRRLARWALALVLLLVVGLPLLALAQVPADAQRYRRDLVRAARYVFGAEAPVAVLAAQIHQESRWRADAVSPAGARGVAQFMPATAAWIAEAYPAELGNPEPHNPAWAVRALARYDRWLLERVQGRTDCDRLWAVLRGYNGGLGHWQREARLAVDAQDRRAVDAHCGQASRAPVHCAENLGYPRLILLKWQPLYASWGLGVACDAIGAIMAPALSGGKVLCA
jgi:soluble lytic murein transglycosylase-like protein